MSAPGLRAAAGGSSNDGGMEQRVAALEADMREVKLILSRMEPLLRGIDDRLRKLEAEVAEVKGRASQLPNIWQLLVGGFGLVRFGLPR